MTRPDEKETIYARLKGAGLLREQCYIGGEWASADNGAVTSILDPATGNEIASVPNAEAIETGRAVEAAHQAWRGWRERTAKDRATILRAWHQAILAHQEDLAALITAEQGKPLSEALGEVKYAASFVEWFAEEGKRIYGDTIPSPSQDKRIIVTKEPVGVVAAITPWNFPAAMVTRKAGPALAAGCTVVLKPAPQTPFTALALAALAERAGMPAGVLNVVTGDAERIGNELTSNPLVRKVTFTGSTRVGKLLMERCASTLKRVSFELGGNAPFIVFDDADLDEAVDGLMASKFRNTGQTCVCANRVYVARGVHDLFVEKLKVAVAALNVGNGFHPASQQGPLISKRALQKVEDHAAYVQSPDLARARKVARRLRAGQVSINYPQWDTFAPSADTSGPATAASTRTGRSMISWRSRRSSAMARLLDVMAPDFPKSRGR